MGSIWVWIHLLHSQMQMLSIHTTLPSKGWPRKCISQSILTQLAMHNEQHNPNLTGIGRLVCLRCILLKFGDNCGSAQGKGKLFPREIMVGSNRSSQNYTMLRVGTNLSRINQPGFGLHWPGTGLESSLLFSTHHPQEYPVPALPHPRTPPPVYCIPYWAPNLNMGLMKSLSVK